MSQKIIVTTSPWKDYQTNKWMLSAMVSVQLDAGVNTKLSAFPDMLQWIDKLQQAKFFVQWNNEKPRDITPLSAKWDKELYQKLFHGNITVKSFTPYNIASLKIKSYPVMHINDFILDTYKEVGNLKIDELPKTKFYTQEFKKLDVVTQVQLKQTKPVTNRATDATLNDFVIKGHAGKNVARQTVTQNKAIAFSKAPNPTLDFGQFHNFHLQVDKTIARHPGLIPKPEFEYHDILSIITSYPYILRKLGLVIDFELAGPPPATNGTVRIMPVNLSFDNDVSISSPATAYQSTGKGFYAASKAGSFIDKGMLKINTDDFSVTQMDTDGAAMKLANHADTLNFNFAKNLVVKSNFVMPLYMVNTTPGATNNTPNAPIANANDNDDDDDIDEGLPSLRSAGIGIVRNGLADQMIKKLARNMDLHKAMISPVAALNSPALFNTVKPGAGPATNNPSSGPITTTTIGAPGKPISVARMQDIGKAIADPVFIPVATEVLYADDLVFGYRLDIAYEDKPTVWYSLHKRKNSYAFVPVGGTSQAITVSAADEIDEGCIHLSLAEDQNDAEQDQKINEVMARWEGWSLAVPRIGKGLSTDTTPGKELNTDEEERKKYQLDKDTPFRLQVDIQPAPKSLPMLRFGKNYRLKVRTVDIAGNGLPHDVAPENESVAVRTNIKYQRYEPLPCPVIVQADEVVSGDKKNMRDRDGESLQHMVIRSNVNVNTADYEKNNITTMVISQKPAGTLTYLHEAIRFFKAPRTSQYMAEVHGMFDESFKSQASAIETYQFIKERDNPTIDDGKTKAPQLPPETGQVDIDYLADPMAAGVIFTMKSDTSFETPWKKNDSRKFSFYFDDEVNDSNVGRNYTTGQWRAPRSFKVKLVEGSGAPGWSGRVFIIPLPKSAQVEVKYACFWRPEDLDRTSAILNRMGAAPGTRVLQQVRKGVHWMFSPWRTMRLVHAVQQPLEKPVLKKENTIINKDYDDTSVTITSLLTVHGSSTDKTDVEAVWKEWIDDLSEEAPRQVDGKTHVATVPVMYGDKQLYCSMSPTAIGKGPRRPMFQQHFGDTKHRMINYTPVATTRYREYFTGIIETARQKGKLNELSLIQTGDALSLNILSSARPVVPVIAYVVPSFNWVKNDKGNDRTHLKTSNIRVYLKRPWYSSGDDERLAVILPPKGTDPTNNPVLKKYCTVWGKDPAFIAPDLNNSNYPQVDHFPFAADYDRVKLLEENVQVDVAAYKVLFDAEKQLHYADIPINVGFAYFPFVKLSLARYQHHSIRKDGGDCCLSGMVKADWLQVVAARTTSVKADPRSRNALVVELKGIAPFSRNPDTFAAAAGNMRVKISITIESAQFAKTEEAYISINDRQTRTTFWSKDYALNNRQIINGAIDFSERVELDNAWASQPFRVVIREYELHEYDPIRAQERAFTNPTAYHEYGERLVFMDVYEMGGSSGGGRDRERTGNDLPIKRG